jgi:chromatin assembly factor 1 subunit A
MMLSFFKKTEKVEKPKEAEKQDQRFKPFDLKENSRLANSITNLCCRTSDERFWESVNTSSLISEGETLGRDFWKSFKTSKSRSRRSLVRETPKFKLLQFHTEYRPAYWGSFQGKSKIVSGKRPLAQDSGLFDYSFDSDDEWEDDDPNAEVISDAESEEDDEDLNGTSIRKDGLEEDGWLLPEDEDHCFAAPLVCFFNISCK